MSDKVVKETKTKAETETKANAKKQQKHNMQGYTFMGIANFDKEAAKLFKKEG